MMGFFEKGKLIKNRARRFAEQSDELIVGGQINAA